jgi:hypothetical protein
MRSWRWAFKLCLPTADPEGSTLFTSWPFFLFLITILTTVKCDQLDLHMETILQRQPIH